MSQLFDFNFGEKWDQWVSRLRSPAGAGAGAAGAGPPSPTGSVGASTPVDLSPPSLSSSSSAHSGGLFFFPPPNSRALPPSNPPLLPSTVTDTSLHALSTNRDRRGSALSNHSFESQFDAASVLRRPSATNTTATGNGPDEGQGSQVSPTETNGGGAGGTTAAAGSGGLLRLLQKKVLPSQRGLGPGTIDTDHWLDDDSAHHCYECHEPFTTFRRRHHCRVCGLIYCSKCSSNFLPGEIVGRTGSLRTW